MSYCKIIYIMIAVNFLSMVNDTVYCDCQIIILQVYVNDQIKGYESNRAR